MSELTLLVISDTHAVDCAETELPDASRQCSLGRELLERALRDARHAGGFGAVAVLGDMTEDGGAPGAESDLAAQEQTLYELAGETPRLVIPGNHDPAPEVVLSIFDDQPGLHEIGDYRFFTFVDGWDDDEAGHRPIEQMERFQRVARPSNDAPLIVLQHNPLHPPIDCEYPFILAERGEVMRSYEEADVLLSISAHYHPGQALTENGGVHYWTNAALSEPPFRYALIHLDGRTISIDHRQLRLPETPALTDVHAHTHYAYCGENVTPREVIQRARVFGLAGQCLTEHADQLYLTEEEHRSGIVFDTTDYWERELPAESRRMPRYRQEVNGLRDEYVQLGLEIELDGKGRPGVRPEDMKGWDLLLGAVHWLPGDVDNLSFGEVKRAFMENVQGLLEADIDVLAHPFRFFHARQLPDPVELYEPLSSMLAEHGVAAEINFHHNTPDPGFFTLCVENGVPIAFGSDSHRLSEVAAFHPHLNLLADLDVSTDPIECIYTPGDRADAPL